MHLREAARAAEQEIADLDQRRAELVETLGNIRQLIGDPLPDEGFTPTPKKRRERRTNAEIERLRKEIRNEVLLKWKLSSQIFSDLVQQQVLQDVRKDRDFTMRELKNLAKKGEIAREGDWFFEIDKHLHEEPF